MAEVDARVRAALRVHLSQQAPDAGADQGEPAGAAAWADQVRARYCAALGASGAPVRDCPHCTLPFRRPQMITTDDGASYSYRCPHCAAALDSSANYPQAPY